MKGQGGEPITGANSHRWGETELDCLTMLLQVNGLPARPKPT
jgi:hypothetical protein